jgi:UDP-glucose 4-epimerase
MVVPRSERQALLGREITVHLDGEQRRSFCHVCDTVGELVSLRDHQGAVGDVFNVGAQHELTINELARLVIGLTGSSSRVVTIPYNGAYEQGFEDMQRRVPDISKIRPLTGWEPTIPLEGAAADVVDHERRALEPSSPAVLVEEVSAS